MWAVRIGGRGIQSVPCVYIEEALSCRAFPFHSLCASSSVYSSAPSFVNNRALLNIAAVTVGSVARGIAAVTRVAALAEVSRADANRAAAIALVAGVPEEHSAVVTRLVCVGEGSSAGNIQAAVVVQACSAAVAPVDLVVIVPVDSATITPAASTAGASVVQPAMAFAAVDSELVILEAA